MNETAAIVDSGCRLADEGKFEEAAAAFEQAIARGELWVNLNLGNSLLELGKYEDAVTAYQAAVDEGEFSAWYNLYLAYSELGMTKLAREALRQAAEAGDSKAYAQTVIDAIDASGVATAQVALQEVPGEHRSSRDVRMVSEVLKVLENEGSAHSVDEGLLASASDYLDLGVVAIVLNAWRKGDLPMVAKLARRYFDSGDRPDGQCERYSMRLLEMYGGDELAAYVKAQTASFEPPGGPAPL